jgi:hypothetical protein
VAPYGPLGFVRKMRSKFLNFCKGEFHLLVCVQQIGDHLEIIFITLKAIKNLIKYSEILGLLNSEPALQHFAMQQSGYPLRSAKC